MHVCMQAKADRDMLNEAHKSAQQTQHESLTFQKQLESLLSQQRASEAGSVLNGAADASAANEAEAGVSVHIVTVVQLHIHSQEHSHQKSCTMQGISNLCKNATMACF